MSRIGKQPVTVPANVKIDVAKDKISVEGPLGKLDWDLRPEITVKFDADSKQVVVSRDGDSRLARALHGLSRAVIANMVVPQSGHSALMYFVGAELIGLIWYLSVLRDRLRNGTAGQSIDALASSRIVARRLLSSSYCLMKYLFDRAYARQSSRLRSSPGVYSR